MKPLLHACAMAIVAAMPVAGQARPSEIGMQGGFVRAKPAGTGEHDHTDLWDLPGQGSPYSGLFVIIPLTARLSLEPGIAGAHSSFREASDLLPATSSSSFRLIARINVELTAGLYAAAGGTVRHLQSDDVQETQLGLLFAIGVRQRLGSRLTARLEAQALAQHKTEAIAPATLYAVQLGISHPIARAARADTLSGGHAGRRPWRLEAGVSGGYVRSHLYGNAFGIAVDVDETLLALPGSGTTGPPAAYVIVPLSGRFTLETGFDARRSQEGGVTLANAHGAVRLDVAIVGGFYAGAGGDFLYIEQTGSSGFAFAGATIAAGHRWQLVPGISGRVQVSYTAFKERQNFPFAQNILGVTLGIAMALQ